MYTALAFAPQPRSWHVPVCLDAGDCKMGEGARFPVPFGGVCAAAPLPNYQGTGYYRFALDESEWQRQIADAAKLDPAGQITLIGSVFAGLRAGKASATDALTLVHVLAPVARWDVLRTLAKRLLVLRQSLPDSDLPAYRALIGREFLARWKAADTKARPGEKPSDALARQYLAALMVTEARDPAVIAQLSVLAYCRNLPFGMVEEGCAYDGAPEIHAEVLRAALIANPAYADVLVRQFEASNQENDRRNIIYAFAGSTDPRAIGQMLALAAGKIRTGELRYLYEFMQDEPVARQTLWAFVGVHFDAFARRLTVQGMGRSAGILATACDAGARSSADAFFHAKLGGALGAARRIAHTEESIDRCIALRKAKGAEISAALAAAH
jgi:hypothetical protein